MILEGVIVNFAKYLRVNPLLGRLNDKYDNNLGISKPYMSLSYCEMEQSHGGTIKQDEISVMHVMKLDEKVNYLPI